MGQRNDIEDVLSSIRRLVANEAGAAVEARASRALILDQAQRVTEPEDPFQTVQGLPEPAPEEEETDEAEAPNIAPPEEDVAPILPLTDPEPTPDPVGPKDAAPGRAEAPADLSDLSARIGGDEALRELIAEIVRQELAGALGERITRNVRKLVRRELRLMMSGEEFD
ncbi:hypothetical protein [Jannaschia formosa]|uniref:hypothetical protein n=1 Tax=Jannaschia formosa TaxID=2259592 RepID=UPI000E1C2F79|nr:hypothetical protein [Jannaschia formosa]TFL17033.1 hypothetical protein DR046_16605 [Jannaschia formosa]